MAFKINVAHKGKTKKFETSNEELVGTKIGDKIDGKIISDDLEGYELSITGTSDKAGFMGRAEIAGVALKRVLLKRGKGMWDQRKGIRLRKTVRGNEISLDTVQINTNVEKEGKTKFDALTGLAKAA
jgi:small subunit ribosomal protein S6e